MSKQSIETIIHEKLIGDTQKNALDFVAFLEANTLALESNGDGEGWAVGGTVENSMGYLLVNGASDMPGPWTLWLNSCDFADDSVDEEVKETAWAHAGPCGHCHAGWKDCGGGDRVIFGKAFEQLCHSPLMFTDPDAKTLENVKKLIMMLR